MKKLGIGPALWPSSLHLWSIMGVLPRRFDNGNTLCCEHARRCSQMPPFRRQTLLVCLGKTVYCMHCAADQDACETCTANKPLARRDKTRPPALLTILVDSCLCSKASIQRHGHPAVLRKYVDHDTSRAQTHNTVSSHWSENNRIEDLSNVNAFGLAASRLVHLPSLRAVGKQDAIHDAAAPVKCPNEPGSQCLHER